YIHGTGNLITATGISSVTKILEEIFLPIVYKDKFIKEDL
ncbi:unnamed protein product, partial [marine sediment metagenome]